MIENHMQVSIVFVNFNEYDSIIRLLTSQRLPDGMGVIVVDNTDPTRQNSQALEQLRSLSHVAVLQADNVGYFGAVRFAMRELPSLGASDFLVVSNTDVDVNFHSLYQRLCERREDYTHSDVGAIAPRLVDSDGGQLRQLHLRNAPSARHVRRVAMLFSSYWALALYRQLGDVKRRLRTRLVSGDTDTALFAPHGAMMIFTQAYLSGPAPFDLPCFLFEEEIYVGLQLEKAQLTCVFDRYVCYSHIAHGSMGRWPSRRVARYLRDAHTWAAVALEERESRQSESGDRP